MRRHHPLVERGFSQGGVSKCLRWNDGNNFVQKRASVPCCVDRSQVYAALSRGGLHGNELRRTYWLMGVNRSLFKVRAPALNRETCIPAIL